MTVDHRPCGADHPHLLSRRLQNRLHHVGGGGLSLGARHAHGDHPADGVAEAQGGHHRQGMAGIFDLHHGHSLRELRLPLHHKGLHPLGRHIRHKPVGVDAAPLHAHENRPGNRLPGVIDHVLRLCIQIPLQHLILQTLQPVRKFHIVPPFLF